MEYSRRSIFSPDSVDINLTAPVIDDSEPFCSILHQIPGTWLECFLVPGHRGLHFDRDHGLWWSLPAVG